MVALFELNCLCAHRGLVNWRFAHIFGFQMKCALSANQNHLSIWLSNWKHSTLIHFIQNVQNNSHTFCVQCCPCDVEPVENGQATPFTWYRIISETRFNFINNTAEECAFIKWRRRSSLAKKKRKKQNMRSKTTTANIMITGETFSHETTHNMLEASIKSTILWYNAGELTMRHKGFSPFG